MALQQKLETKLSQRLVLTPALQQAIKLLPMTTLELTNLLNQEVVENPLLEEVTQEDIRNADNQAKVEGADPDPSVPTEQQDTWDDGDFEYFFGEYLNDGYRPRAHAEFKEAPPLENTLTKEPSLADHLLWQVGDRLKEPQSQEIGNAIIGNLNEDGYLVASLDELASMGGWNVETIEGVLGVVQDLDPVGVAARSLQECLLLQLRALGFTGGPTERILQEAMHLLENKHLPALARHLEVSIDEAKQHVEIIQRLEPKPGRRFTDERSHYVIPDVYVIKLDGDYVATLNEEGLPRLRVNPLYRKFLDRSKGGTAETRAYVREKIQSAIWLLKSIDQRQRTIQKVAGSLIKFQESFLDEGVEHLQPLVLRDVADDIGMHESTVSRVVNNKYMHTPQGVYEMKYFFHSGISHLSGRSVSSTSVKNRIRQIVEAEDVRRPLSDAKIVTVLERDGLVLARRTIAKYREELKIPTASRRKVLY